MPHPCFRNLAGQHTGNLIKRTRQRMAHRALAGTMPMQNEVMPTDWDKKNREEQGYVADYIRRIAKRFGNKMTEKGPYTAPCRTIGTPQDRFLFLVEKYRPYRRFIATNSIPLPPSAACPKRRLSGLFRTMKGTTAVIIPDSPAGWTQRGIPISTSICAAWK